MDDCGHTDKVPSTPFHPIGKQEKPTAGKPGKQVTGKQGEQPAMGQRKPFARAANEDDDGYDPWSDRPVRDPLWEEDPWR